MKLQHDWAYERPGILSGGFGMHEMEVEKRRVSRGFTWHVVSRGVTVASGRGKTQRQAMLCAEAVVGVLEAQLHAEVTP